MRKNIMRKVIFQKSGYDRGENILGFKELATNSFQCDEYHNYGLEEK